MSNLAIIPARKGSKGLPGKNVRMLAGKPMIVHTIEAAIDSDCFDWICVSTNDEAVKEIAKRYNLILVDRPEEFSSDTATSDQVIRHTIENITGNLAFPDRFCLLQPTSPLRRATDICAALALFAESADGVVSVFESKSNPYYNLFEPDALGYLNASKPNTFTRRQDCPIIYELNGAIYWYQTKAYISKQISDLRRLPYVMPGNRSIDIDDLQDFVIAERMIANELV